MSLEEMLAEFVRDRNEALLSLDEEKIRAYGRKYQVVMPDDPEIFWGAVHKARSELVALPAEARAFSRAWLIEHGMYPGVLQNL